jgi:predicted negative regulator of RcsB-dependent stress response
METENEELTSPVQTTNSPSALESFLNKHWKTLSLAVVASLIIFAALHFYKASNGDKTLARGQKLVSVSMDDSSISSLLEFASKNEGTVSGNNAKLIIAERYTNGDSPDLEKAKKYLSEFIAKADQTNPFYYDAKFSLATLLEKTGNTKEAKRIFEEVSLNESNSKNAAKIRLADLLVQNKKFDEAIVNYFDAGKATNYTT